MLELVVYLLSFFETRRDTFPCDNRHDRSPFITANIVSYHRRTCLSTGNKL
jgi:hypothetical protein